MAPRCNTSTQVGKAAVAFHFFKICLLVCAGTTFEGMTLR